MKDVTDDEIKKIVLISKNISLKNISIETLEKLLLSIKLN